MGQAKVTLYDQTVLDMTRELVTQIISMISRDDVALHPLPPLFNIERWWPPQELRFLQKLKSCICALTPEDSKIRTLLLIAFCRTMIRTSTASFDHQSMSFQSMPFRDENTLWQALTNEQSANHELSEMYRRDVEFVLRSAAINPSRAAEVIEGDARELSDSLNERFDLVVTSPPYPKRMSYIRELRPYMYWLDYFREAREAGELDWKAIGGTWGIVTSRLLQWERSQNSYCPPYLNNIISRIALAENKSGRLLSIYVAKYFEDIWSHLSSIAPLISSGGELHYIVGNSTFYNVLVPTERIFRDMMLELGLVDVSIKTLRKRNSKKELFEYTVSGRKR